MALWGHWLTPSIFGFLLCAFGNIISSGKDVPTLQKENQSQATILDADFIPYSMMYMY